MGVGIFSVKMVNNLRWAKSPIANVQRMRSTLAGLSAGPCGMNATPTNANRAIPLAANAGSTRTNFCVFFKGRDDGQRTLVIRIAAATLANDSAITPARF